MMEPMPPLGESAMRRFDVDEAERIREAEGDARVNRQVRDLDPYLGLLADAVRARGGRKRQVSEVVGEVRGHCLQTGDDPVEAFGLPEEYASARFRPLSPASVVARLFAGAAGALGIVALLAALIPRGDGGEAILTISDLFTGAVMLTVVVLVPWVVYGVERLVLPRWLGRPSASRWLWLVRAAVLVILTAGMLTLGGHLDPATGERILVAGPRWVFLCLASLVVPLLGLAAPSARTVPAPVMKRYGDDRSGWRRATDWLQGRQP